MKVQFTLGIGFANADQEETFDIPEADEMDKEEREKYLEQYWQDWAWNYIDGGYNILDT